MTPHNFGVSVVIPSYNRTAELLRAINSVVTNKHSFVEIIVVDDCSLQNPISLIPNKNSSNVQIKYFRLERNKGPQAARNLAIRRASYSYIAFLDSDDIFSPDKVDLILTEMEREPVDILFHSVSGLPRYRRLILLWRKYFKFFVPFNWLIVLFNPIVTPSLVIRKKRKLGVEKFRYSEDWCYLMRYVDSETTMRYIDAELSEVFRIAGAEGGLSTSFWRMRCGEFAARKVLLRFPSFANLAKFFVGSVAGILRIVNDIVRGRYR